MVFIFNLFVLRVFQNYNIMLYLNLGLLFRVMKIDSKFTKLVKHDFPIIGNNKNILYIL